MSVLDGDPLQEVVKSVIHQYKSSVVPKRSNFRKCTFLFWILFNFFLKFNWGKDGFGVYWLLNAVFSFFQGINHGDFNDLNVLVQPDDDHGYKISGIIDFGDMHSGYYVNELAITIMYLMIEHPDPIEVGGPVLAGWESVFPLNEEEKDCLYWLVLSRFCQSLVLARYSVKLQPENEEYLMITSRKGVKILLRLWEVGKENVDKVWFQHAAEFSK